MCIISDLVMYKFSIGLHLNFGMSVIHGHVLTIAYLQFFDALFIFSLCIHLLLACYPLKEALQ